MLKRCSKCKTSKEVGLFSKDKNTKDGFCSWCKVCMAELQNHYRDTETGKMLKPINQRRYREKNKEKVKEMKDKYYAANKEVISAKRKAYNRTIDGRYKLFIQAARTKGKGFGITLEQFRDLIEDGNCYYCGSSLNDFVGYCLDRIDNDKGYFVDNCIPCCPKCNIAKGVHYTVEEFKIMIDALMDFRTIKLTGRK